MPIVVPTTTNVTSAGSNPAVPSAAEIAATGFPGFDGTFATYQRPLASSTATRSVNVPPVSIPTLIPIAPTLPVCETPAPFEAPGGGTIGEPGNRSRRIQVTSRGVVPFGDQSWEQEAEGVKALVCDVDGARWAIVEYAPGAGRPEFCEVGHEGYVISGEIEYEFESGGKFVC